MVEPRRVEGAIGIEDELKESGSALSPPERFELVVALLNVLESLVRYELMLEMVGNRLVELESSLGTSSCAVELRPDEAIVPTAGLWGRGDAGSGFSWSKLARSFEKLSLGSTTSRCSRRRSEDLAESELKLSTLRLRSCSVMRSPLRTLGVTDRVDCRSGDLARVVLVPTLASTESWRFEVRFADDVTADGEGAVVVKFPSACESRSLWD